jgi:hypothetical protein
MADTNTPPPVDAKTEVVLGEDGQVAINLSAVFVCRNAPTSVMNFRCRWRCPGGGGVRGRLKKFHAKATRENPSVRLCLSLPSLLAAHQCACVCMNARWFVGLYVFLSFPSLVIVGTSGNSREAVLCTAR